LSARRFWPVFLLLAAISGHTGAAYAGPPDYAPERAAMVERLRNSGITNQYVLAAMRKVPRHLFVQPADRARAYDETSIPVGAGEVLYSPKMVATAMQMLAPKPGDKVLQVGAGCGYCTAMLCEITPKVFAVDLRSDLLRIAKARVQALGYSSVKWRNEKGCVGWAENGLYDAILVMCAADKVPKELVNQLKDGGRLVIPVGRGPEQTITCLRKAGERLRSEAVVMPARVEPMVCQPPLP
jgi:protein-L-isoaspartate(D-aspartate) O-methyltransferase